MQLWHRLHRCFLSFLLLFIFPSCTPVNDKKNADTSQSAIEKAIEEVTISKLESLIPYQVGEPIKTGDPVKGSLNGAINLEQGWTEASQQEFYFTSQGSQILPYSWYLSLEQATNRKLFRANENMQRFAYIPSAKTKSNPDGLSIGFAKATRPLISSPDYNKEWVGLTCSACHSTEVSYKGRLMRIDGGPTMADFQAFNRDLVTALEATLEQEAKFKRFAGKILDAFPGVTESVLRADLEKQTKRLSTRNRINHLKRDQAPYGHARVDAIGAIFNQVMSTLSDNPTNARASTAPVSYPFLWGTHQSDVVQWTGFAPNGPFSLGALIRNGGEVLGVYGDIEISEDKSITAYPSTLMFEGLGRLEARVAQLRSPPWPEDMIEPIDSHLAQRGAGLYESYCSGCHQVVPSDQQGRPYKANLTDLSEVKTDSMEILNLITQRDAGIYFGRKEFGVFGPEIPYTTSGLAPLVNSVMGSILDQPKAAIKAAFIQYFGGKLAEMPGNGIEISPEQKEINKEKVKVLFEELKLAYMEIKKAHDRCEKNRVNKEVCALVIDALKFGEKINTDLKDKKKTAEMLAGMVYKGRPLNGIWATAPYLHNGSVPNLMELLMPAEQRSKSFYLGSRELDPVNVGFIMNKTETNTFRFDTTLLGNSNAGHEYATDLSMEDKKAIIEYMKGL